MSSPLTPTYRVATPPVHEPSLIQEVVRAEKASPVQAKAKVPTKISKPSKAKTTKTTTTKTTTKTNQAKKKNIHETTSTHLKDVITKMKRLLKRGDLTKRQKAVYICYDLDSLVQALSKVNAAHRIRSFEVADVGGQKLRPRLEVQLQAYIGEETSSKSKATKDFLTSVNEALKEGMESSILRGYRFAQVMKAAKARLDATSFDWLHDFVTSSKDPCMSSSAVRNYVTRCEFTTAKRLDQLLAHWLGKPYPHPTSFMKKKHDEVRKRIRSDIDEPPKTEREFRIRVAELNFVAMTDTDIQPKVNELLKVFKLDAMKDKVWKLLHDCNARLPM